MSRAWAVCGLLWVGAPVALAEPPAPEGTLVVRVASKDGAQPIGGAVVTVWNESRAWTAATDAMGLARIAGVPEGNVDLRADALRFRGEEQSVEVEAGRGVVLAWYLRHGQPVQDVARARRLRPWDLQKVEPAYSDVLAALRRSLWTARISAKAPARSAIKDRRAVPLKGPDLVFRRRGKKWIGQTIDDHLARATAACGADAPEERRLPEAKRTDLHFHDLRHTAASLMVAAGVPIFDVAKVLGHKRIETTMRYAHFAPDAGRRAIDGLAAALAAKATTTTG
jgi:hypothetical protein